MGLSYDDFSALFPKVRREALHLEMRDSYGTEAEIPHLAKWAAGEPDDLGWLTPWCTLVRDAIAAGKAFRRARIVSEPLSDCLLYTSPSPRDGLLSRMPSSA